jgi:hypothetical protein
MNPIPLVAQAVTRSFTVVANQTNTIFVDEHYAGDTLIIALAFVDEAGVAVNISTYSSLTAGLYTAAGVLALSLTAALSGGGTGGLMTLTAAAAASAALDGDYRLELQVANAGVTVKYTAVTGIVRVQPTY